jgi:hypothetical protein
MGCKRSVRPGPATRCPRTLSAGPKSGLGVRKRLSVGPNRSSICLVNLSVRPIGCSTCPKAWFGNPESLFGHGACLFGHTKQALRRSGLAFGNGKDRFDETNRRFGRSRRSAWITQSVFGQRTTALRAVLRAGRSGSEPLRRTLVRPLDRRRSVACRGGARAIPPPARSRGFAWTWWWRAMRSGPWPRRACWRRSTRSWSLGSLRSPALRRPPWMRDPRRPYI